jgi:GTP-binding protein HflX
LKRSVRARFEKLRRRKVSPNEVISPELSRDLARLSFESGRQAGLLLDRAGQVHRVLVGDSQSILIPELPESRVERRRLRGLRFVHTHLKGESISRDDLMDLVFLRLDCLAVIHVDDHGGATTLELAHILPENKRDHQGWEILPPVPCRQTGIDFLQLVRSLEDEMDRNLSATTAGKDRDRAILVSVTDADRKTATEKLEELEQLALTSGIVVADRVIQRYSQINPKHLIGKGKLSEISIRALQIGVDLLIFDQELNPSQIRALTDLTELRVIDRTQLILDIFAQRAQSRGGKIQVEMAQLKYLRPRLGVRDDALSRLTGGIGARGPGETKLEIDRRRINERITRLENQLKVLRKNRAQKRALRLRKKMPTISIVGYTNAGKSTLLNALTKSDVFVEDQLFATLDPSSKRLRFPRDFEAVITDTVGFIRDLPQDLVDAFAATLEELDEADLLLHVVDAGAPDMDEQIDAVGHILEKLGLGQKPTILVFNKMDLVRPELLEPVAKRYGGVAISALSRGTLKPLIRKMETYIEPLCVSLAGFEETGDAAGFAPKASPSQG